jgi:hypothetical protein
MIYALRKTKAHDLEGFPEKKMQDFRAPGLDMET